MRSPLAIETLFLIDHGCQSKFVDNEGMRQLIVDGLIEGRIDKGVAHEYCQMPKTLAAMHGEQLNLRLCAGDFRLTKAGFDEFKRLTGKASSRDDRALVEANVKAAAEKFNAAVEGWNLACAAAKDHGMKVRYVLIRRIGPSQPRSVSAPFPLIRADVQS